MDWIKASNNGQEAAIEKVSTNSFVRPGGASCGTQDMGIHRHFSEKGKAIFFRVPQLKALGWRARGFGPAFVRTDHQHARTGDSGRPRSRSERQALALVERRHAVADRAVEIGQREKLPLSELGDDARPRSKRSN
jgi:hypothetical protein